MPTLRTRAAKGSDLTPTEADNDFKRSVSAKTTTYNCLIGDNRNVIECNSATPFTVTLGNAATMAAAETGDYEVTIVNIGSGAVTVARSGTDVIDGATISFSLSQYSSATLKVNFAANGYNSISNNKNIILLSANTFSGSNTFSNNNTFSGSNTFSSPNSHTQREDFAVITILPPTTGGTTTAYTATLGLTAYTSNRVYDVKINATNTTASTTINLDSLGAKTIKLLNGNDAYIGALKIGMIAKFLYDGTNMVLLNPDKPFRGALLSKSANQSISSSVATAVTFNTESYDTDGLHDTVTNNDRITIPASLNNSYLTLKATIVWDFNTLKSLYIVKNALTSFIGQGGCDSVDYTMQIQSDPILVSTGDYFRFFVAQTSGLAKNIYDNDGGVFLGEERITSASVIIE